MREKASLEHTFGGLIQILIFILIICVPLIFVKTLHNSFIIPKRALIQFLIFEMFLLWLMKMTLQREYKIVKSPLYVPLFLFLGIEILSVLWAENRYLSLHLIWQNVAFGLFVVVVINTIRDEKLFRRIVIASVCTAAVVAIIGFFPYFKIDILSIYKGIEYKWVKIAMISTIGHYNFLAAFLNISIPSSLMMVFLYKNQKKRLLFGIISFLLIFTLLLTKSRGAWLGFIAALAVLFVGFLYRRKRKERIKVSRILSPLFISVILCTLLVAVGIYISSEIYVGHGAYTLKDWIQYFTTSTTERAVSSFYINTGSALHRRIIWIPTLHMIRDNIFIGVGKNNFQIMYPYYTPDQYKETLKFLTHRGTKAHNEYLQVIAETGILGLLTFLAFLFVLVRTAVRSLKQYKSEGGSRYFLRLGILAGICATLVHSLVSHPLRLPSSALYFWLFAGLMVALYRPERENEKTSRQFHGFSTKNGRVKWIICTVFVCIMILIPIPIWKSIAADYYIKKGDKYFVNERYDEALAFYEKTLSFGCQDSEVYRNIGRIHLQKQRYAAAIQSWQRDRELNPHFPVIYKYLGSAYFLNGELPLSEQMLIKALQIYPGYTEARERLKELYQRWGLRLEEKGRIEEAKELYLRSLQTFDDEEQFHLRLGYLYYKTGQAKEAVREFEFVIRTEPGCAEAYKALGYIFYRSSRPQRAIPYYEHYLTLNPEDPQRRNVEEELKTIQR